MKIGILTFHMAHNYGAMLQAYALREKICQMNLDCQVIDYRIPVIYNWHRKDKYRKLVRDNGFIIGSMKYTKRILTRYYTKDKRWCGFNNFMENDIGISSETYEEVNELKNLYYDTYICGSDQIWNAEHSGGIESGYFLNFTNNDVRRIAYAASKGPVEILDNEKDTIFNLLSKFDYIGVREKGLKESLEAIGLKDIEWVLDPTLLLKSSEWLKIANNRKVNNYVLVYKITEDPKLYYCARKIAKEKNCKIIEITYKKNNNLKDIIQLEDCGPREFIGLFSKANYIVTNSFHGTCFSIIFNKIFYSVPFEGLSSRMDSLLSLLGLDERKVYDFENFSLNDNINFKEANIKLDKEREKSIEFLRKSLGLN